MPADVLTLDLADAVAPEAKPVARDRIAAALRVGGYSGREIVVRVNGLDTQWGQADMAAIAGCGADADFLPKVESAAIVHAAEAAMESHDAPGATAIWCMMDTPISMLHAKEVAGASARVASLVMGTADLAKDLHTHHTPGRLPPLTSLGLCLLAPHAHGLAIPDGVHLELCFGGKTLIHPKTIAEANAIFTPSTGEVAYARRIIAAHAEAAAAGQGVVLVDGRLIESLHVAGACRFVAMAEAIGALGAAQ